MSNDGSRKFKFAFANSSLPNDTTMLWRVGEYKSLRQFTTIEGEANHKLKPKKTNPYSIAISNTLHITEADLRSGIIVFPKLPADVSKDAEISIFTGPPLFTTKDMDNSNFEDPFAILKSRKVLWREKSSEEYRGKIVGVDAATVKIQTQSGEVQTLENPIDASDPTFVWEWTLTPLVPTVSQTHEITLKPNDKNQWEWEGHTVVGESCSAIFKEIISVFIQEIDSKMPTPDFRMYVLKDENRYEPINDRMDIRSILNNSNVRAVFYRPGRMKQTPTSSAVQSLSSESTHQKRSKSAKPPSNGESLDETRRGKALSVAERKQIMHLLDMMDSKQNRTTKELTYKRIAELTGKHVNTITKMRRERDRQGCVRVNDIDGNVRTVSAPEAGQQGGFRWCRMNDEQKQLCTRIAIENPRLTVGQIRAHMLESDPDLSISESTIWRTLNMSNLQFLRAKMRDPRANATTAHQMEKDSFLRELAKGSAGELGAADLFFMDETTIYLNETARRAWGTAEHPAEIKKAKGKTVTIGIYAGIGLVTAPLSSEEWKERDLSAHDVPKLATDPRSNAFNLIDGKWTRSGAPPRFAIFWWLRPPTRSGTVLDRFINVEDVLDSSFKLAYKLSSGQIEEESLVSPTGELNQDFALHFLQARFDLLNADDLQLLLWRNNIEWRQVDEDGVLIGVIVRNRKQPQRVLLSVQAMIDLFSALKKLVIRAVRAIGKRIDKPDLQKEIEGKSTDTTTKLPRAYYSKMGSRKKGGRIEGERGDQSLFLQYIDMTTDYYNAAFPEFTRTNLRMAWDSAPQHGKVDVTKNKKSFIHEWVEQHLGIRGAIFLPVREPDYNPAELLFSFVKSVVRRRMHSPTGELSETAMIEMVDRAFLEVTEDMVKGWLRYGCYRIDGDDPALVDRTHRCQVSSTVVETFDVIENLLTSWEIANEHRFRPNERMRLLTGDVGVIDAIGTRYPTIRHVFLENPDVLRLAWSPDGHAIQVDEQKVFKNDNDILHIHNFLVKTRNQAMVKRFHERLTLLLKPVTSTDKSPKELHLDRESALGDADVDVVFKIGKEHYENKEPKSVAHRNVGPKWVPKDLFKTFDNQQEYDKTSRDNKWMIFQVQKPGGFAPFQVNFRCLALDNESKSKASWTKFWYDPYDEGLIVLSNQDSSKFAIFEHPGDKTTSDEQVAIPLTQACNLRLFSHKKWQQDALNSKGAKFDALRQIIKARDDETGWTASMMLIDSIVLEANTRQKMEELKAYLNGKRGLLFFLRQAAKKASQIAGEISQHVTTAASNLHDGNLLLDAHERLFHTRLDARTAIELKNGKNDGTYTMEVAHTRGHAHRTIPNQAIVFVKSESIPPSLPTSMSGALQKIDSKTATLKVSSAEYTIGNRRLIDAIIPTGSKTFATQTASILTNLRHTPYMAGFPVKYQAEPAYELGVAAVAQRAYLFEKKRRDRVASAFAQRFQEIYKASREANQLQTTQFQSDLNFLLDESVARWKRTCTDGKCTTEDGAIVEQEDGASSLEASAQAPLFRVSQLRADRRSDLQMRMLARGEPDERRWPGYPLSEKNARDGKTIETVQPGERIEVEYSPPVLSVYIKRFLTKDIAEMTITFENGDVKMLPKEYKEQVEPKDAHKFLVKKSDLFENTGKVQVHGTELRVQTYADVEYVPIDRVGYEESYKRIFGEYSKMNQYKFDNAKQRYEEFKEKAKLSEANDTMSENAERAIGVFEGSKTLRYANSSKVASLKYLDQHTIINNAFVLYHPDKAAFFLAPGAVISSETLSDSSKLKIGLYDERIMSRQMWADYWYAIPSDEKYERLELNEDNILRENDDYESIEGTNAFVSSSYFSDSPKPSYKQWGIRKNVEDSGGCFIEEDNSMGWKVSILDVRKDKNGNWEALVSFITSRSFQNVDFEDEWIPFKSVSSSAPYIRLLTESDVTEYKDRYGLDIEKLNYACTQTKPKPNDVYGKMYKIDRAKISKKPCLIAKIDGDIVLPTFRKLRMNYAESVKLSDVKHALRLCYVFTAYAIYRFPAPNRHIYYVKMEIPSSAHTIDSGGIVHGTKGDTTIHYELAKANAGGHTYAIEKVQRNPSPPGAPPPPSRIILTKPMLHSINRHYSLLDLLYAKRPLEFFRLLDQAMNPASSTFFSSLSEHDDGSPTCEPLR